MIVLTLTMVVGLVACGQPEEQADNMAQEDAQMEETEEVAGDEELPPGIVDTSEYATEPPWRVANAGLGATNAWMVMFRHHFNYAVNEKHGDLFEEFLMTSAMYDPTQQISDAQSLLAQDIDLLFLPAATEGALVGVVEEAMSRGIPVVLVSAGVNTDNYVTYVSRDDQQVGYKYGTWMAEQLDGEGNVAVFMGVAGSSYAEDVYKGVQQALSEYPDLEEVAMANADWSPVEAKEAMEAFMQRDEEIDGIISDGGQMALGAAEALIDAGEPVPPITTDDWNGWLRLAAEHDIEPWYAVTGGNPMSVDAVDLAVKILRGEPVPKNVNHAVTEFTHEDLDEHYRPDLIDQYFAIHKLPESWIEEHYSR